MGAVRIKLTSAYETNLLIIEQSSALFEFINSCVILDATG